MLFNRDIDKRFPSVAYLEKEAQHRIPRFALDYLSDGLGDGLSVNRNRQALQDVVLMPRYMVDADEPQLSCELLGFDYDAPFGVAPMGASGVVWPRSEFILAKAAKDHNILYSLSTVANASIEQIGAITGDNGWFQLYTPKPLDILKSLLERCKNSGFKTLIVTVDVPVRTRREHLIHSGWSVPPRFDLRTLVQMVARPAWALRMLRSGVPQFVNLRPYSDPNSRISMLDSIRGTIRLTSLQMGGHITSERFRIIRDLWDGKLLVKGILDPDDAKGYLKLGADGLIISNHGGRQLDAAPSVTYALPRIREVVGSDVPLIADGGVRSGLDIARLLALGANFVLLGRPFLYAVAALDELGWDHVMNILKMELQQAMGQLGCQTLDELSDRLVKSNAGMWAVQDLNL